jgi:NitT/TauT family transport system ATP-binding protein
VLTADSLRTEILKIFLGRKTATRSMILVTHNIHEAVLMAKRILVMGVNPGHVRDEIQNNLPYPRDEKSALFTRKVSQIHDLITETLMPDITENPQPVSTREEAGDSPIQVIPNVPIYEMIGLVEAIASGGGAADIFRLSQSIGKDFGQTLYLVKAAELLDLVDTPKQQVVLTDRGRLFVAGDINVRKRMLHELLGKLHLVRLITDLLKRSETLRLPIDMVEDRIVEWLPNEDPHATMNVLIAWGRFAEYFGYNDDAKELYLDVGQETS